MVCFYLKYSLTIDFEVTCLVWHFVPAKWVKRLGVAMACNCMPLDNPHSCEVSHCWLSNQRRPRVCVCVEGTFEVGYPVLGVDKSQWSGLEYRNLAVTIDLIPPCVAYSYSSY